MAAGRKFKSGLKSTIKHLVMIPGRFLRLRGGRILTYHSIGARDHEMNVTPGDFRVQMEWLAQHAKVVSLQAIAEGTEGVAITFDDGYQDNLLYAAPVLEALGLPATFFVVPGRLGGMLDHDWDEEHSTLMTWDEISALEQKGFELGAHTMTHPRLSHLSEDGQQAEISGSAKALQDALGHPVAAFAYPFGSAQDYDPDSIRLVQEAGFRFAVSNRYGVNYAPYNLWALRRIWIDATDTLTTFRAKVDGRLDGLCLLDSPAGVWIRSRLNRFLNVDGLS